MRFLMVWLVATALVILVVELMPSEHPVRSVYDVDYEQVGWCMYDRFDAYDSPEQMGHKIRFCVVVEPAR
jgi:hypothetical protein